MSKKITLSENALEVTQARYFSNGEGWEGCCYRVAKASGDVEIYDRPKYIEAFNEMIYEQMFIPAGRILRNAGTATGSLFNCFVLPIGDSIEEIGDYMRESLILWSNGGGVGCNFSPLRPKQDPILGKGGKSSGLLSFLIASDHLAHTIESGGSRRAAALACVDVSHPEVLDFINAKVVDGEIQHYNISVGINNEFLEAVERNKDWEFKFKQRTYGKKPAREIWNLIIENMIKNGEPGLLNFTNLAKNNSYYYDPITAVNPCGEVPLAPYGICNLGSLVLPNFITGNINTNWKKLESTISLAVRFLDNIIEINKYSLKENDIKAHNSRRIGIGVMGLAEYLFAKQLRYGSVESINEIERLFRCIRNCVYQTSVELAIEKGAFPKFDPIAYTKASFIRKLPMSLRLDIKDKGIRNVTLMAIAPTGTISLIADVTNSTEPLYSKAYKRTDCVSSRYYIHPIYQEILEQRGERPDWFVDTSDLQMSDHFDVQSIVQKYTDSSVAKTINLSKGMTAKELDRLLLEYTKDLKGVTVYVDGSREGQILETITHEKALEVLKEGRIENYHLQNEECNTDSCEI